MTPEDINPQSTLLSVKELATILKRSTAYVYAMKKAGFKMLHNRTTLQEAKIWLADNPDFKTTPKKYVKKSKKI